MGFNVSDLVFSVLAEIFVIILDKIFKDLSKEIVLLLKHIGKAEFHQLIDDSAAEQGLLMRQQSVQCRLMKKLMP